MSVPNPECAGELELAFANYYPLIDRIVRFHPDAISANFPHDSDIPVAAVCLRDCQTTVGQIVHAFHLYCSEGAEYRSASPPADMMATWVERFYVEDIAMRIYSAAEHLASGIAMLRSMDDPTLKSFKVASQWERVRKALTSRAPTDPILLAMNRLREDPTWQFSITYRGSVVHDQPPTLHGLGILYRRQRRWQQAADGTKVLHVGTGDQPEHSVAEVRARLLQATSAFVEVLMVVVDQYVGILNARSISEGEGGLTL